MRPSPTSRRRRPLRALAALAAAVAVPLALPVAGARAEAPETVVGEVVQAWADQGSEAGHAHADAPLTWVESGDGSAVRLPAEAAGQLPVGATVEVTVGGEVTDEAAGEGYEPARDLLTADVLGDAPVVAPARTAPLTNEVTVVRVVPPGGAPDGTSVAQLVDAVDGPVAEFWAGETGGALRFGVTAIAPDWVRTTADCSQPTALWNEVAAAVAFPGGPGRHLLVYLGGAQAAGCGWAMGEVGAGPGAGGRVYVSEVLPSVITHELGHNLGLGHSSARQCDGAVETGSCRTAAYRDYYDVMGASWDRVGSLNAVQATALGVLPAEASVVVSGVSTTLTLAPWSGRAGTRAARLTDAEGATYWLEYRAATGRDDWLGTAVDRFALQAGVLLRRAGAMPDTSLLLDGSPSAAAGWDADRQVALPVGAPVPVSGGDLTVTVEQLTPAGATVTVIAAPGGEATTPLPGTAPGGPSVLPASAAGGTVPAPAGTPDPAPAVGPTTPVPPPGAADPAENGTAATTSELAGTVTRASAGDGGLPVAVLSVLAGGVLVAGGWAVARARARRRT